MSEKGLTKREFAMLLVYANNYGTGSNCEPIAVTATDNRAMAKLGIDNPDAPAFPQLDRP